MSLYLNKSRELKDPTKMENPLDKYKLKRKAVPVSIKNKSLRQLYKRLVDEKHQYVTQHQISKQPPMKLCDITGLPAFYTCPKTGLRFYDISVFEYIRGLTPDQTERYRDLKDYGSRYIGK